MRSRAQWAAVLALSTMGWTATLGQSTSGGSAKSATGGAVLNAEQAGELLPDQVFFRGQSATTQKRNSGGVKFAGGMYALAILVDTGGYSSAVQQKYQGFLIAEEPLEIEGKRLEPGEYGFGFVAGNRFVVMDVGAHDLLSAPDKRDTELRHPTPLQVTAAGSGYRLYGGRNYITFSRAP
jgi:hypothetical protein